MQYDFSIFNHLSHASFFEELEGKGLPETIKLELTEAYLYAKEDQTGYSKEFEGNYLSVIEICNYQDGGLVVVPGFLVETDNREYMFKYRKDYQSEDLNNFFKEQQNNQDIALTVGRFEQANEMKTFYRRLQTRTFLHIIANPPKKGLMAELYAANCHGMHLSEDRYEINSSWLLEPLYCELKQYRETIMLHNKLQIELSHETTKIRQKKL